MNNINSFVRFQNSSHKKQKKINCQKINSKIFDKKNRLKIRYKKLNWNKIKILINVFCFDKRKNEKTKNFEKIKKLNVLNENYFEKFEMIVQYLWNFKKSFKMIISKFQKWKKRFLFSKCKIVNFFVKTSKMYFY